MNSKIDPNWVIEEVEKIVAPVYLVGGSVRDMLIGREPKDYDFCTPLSPDEIEEKIKAAGRKTHISGKRFGTIGFGIPIKGGGKALPIEVTTFRTERYTAGSRKPEVEFVQDLKEDLGRRDFTFNAIALKDSKYFDPFAGRLDIMAKKIKAVGNASDRFKEDPLRMLRAARFASQLNFEVDPNMVGKIRKMPQTILGIARERWVQEIDKLLTGENPEAGIKVLTDTHLLKYMIPEVWLVTQDKYLLQEMVRKIKDAPKDADVRWGMFLMDVAKPITKEERKATRGFTYTNNATYKHSNLIGLGVANGICLRLKFSVERTKTIQDIVLKERYENKEKQEVGHEPKV